jgi:hypothetical protein
VVDKGVLELISDVAAKSPIDGDIRVALDPLLYSGRIDLNFTGKMVRGVGFEPTNPYRTGS